MIYQKDWLMRQIESIIAAIMHFLVSTQKPESDVQSLREYTEEIDRFLKAEDICGAENWLYNNTDEQDITWLRVAVYFYQSINAYTDEYLEEHNFSRDEIITGLKDMCERFGFGHIL